VGRFLKLCPLRKSKSSHQLYFMLFTKNRRLWNYLSRTCREVCSSSSTPPFYLYIRQLGNKIVFIKMVVGDLVRSVVCHILFSRIFRVKILDFRRVETNSTWFSHVHVICSRAKYAIFRELMLSIFAVVGGLKDLSTSVKVKEVG
jgi:hypothetical protein